jgi:hypothetical protein
VAEDVGALAARLFSSVMAPLVLGGVLRPAHPIGARAAIALMTLAPRPHDSDLASRVDLLRVVEARKLAPIDTVDDPGGAEWALAAVLHDVIQATNPAWVRRSPPRRLLDLAAATLERVPPPASAREALARHTWFSRVFDVHRKDTDVSWWTGSSRFLGVEPPKRLMMWSDVRRVNVQTSARGVMELLAHGGQSEHAPAFASVMTQLLRATPLTDFATCGRSSPAFIWSSETLALSRSPVARTLAVRALAFAPSSEACDAGLGRATRALFFAKDWKHASEALDFLGHRTLAMAQAADGAAPTDLSDDALFARAAGATLARRWLDDPAVALSDADRRRLVPVLDAALRTGAAKELATLMELPR